VPEPLAEADVQAQLEEFDVDGPRVGILMGSESDMEMMEKAARELEERGIVHEVRVMSAHREPISLPSTQRTRASVGCA
jgi:phosphoribosylcarboxyaminoimidazole (NCAIR) mutase